MYIGSPWPNRPRKTLFEPRASFRACAGLFNNVIRIVRIWYITYIIKNPFVNALIAGGYIIALVLFMRTVIEALSHTEDTILIPMTMLSLFVFSVALMAILFFFEPIRLLLENQKQEALSFFTKTLATFFCFVAILLTLMVYTSLL
jgi:hypothetical protein